ncbi:unnamed protein product [Cyclocybe aegerita]|uniref:Uncharacterized protein n=1 Tax=Cyclocybe aegerita TaxID=1973307 RepID=A0A8S0W200_CYCAE|nr:unnamed protein product [Cyclocybe aegerita]
MLDTNLIAATANRLTEESSKALSFDENAYTLSTEPPQEQTFFTQLAETAQNAAFAQSCSSILVGAGNESDETGDLPFWLGSGNYGPGNSKTVLSVLGLEQWAENITAAEPQLTPELNELLHKMEYRYSFRTTSGSSVAVFVVGKLGDGWGGLVGLGVWT